MEEKNVAVEIVNEVKSEGALTKVANWAAKHKKPLTIGGIAAAVIGVVHFGKKLLSSYVVYEEEAETEDSEETTEE